jgi:hypothetical protein
MRLVSAILLFLALIPSSARAALPPFELAQKAIAEARTARGDVTRAMQITESGRTLTEYRLSGTFGPNDTATLEGEPKRTLGPDASTPYKLLWIALLAADPVAEVTKRWGFVDKDDTEVQLDDGFVYVYGGTPQFSIARDMRRLVAFEIAANGHRWRVRLTWRDGDVVGALVTRDGSPILTARARPTK